MRIKLELTSGILFPVFTISAISFVCIIPGECIPSAFKKFLTALTPASQNLAGSVAAHCPTALSMFCNSACNLPGNWLIWLINLDTEFIPALNIRWAKLFPNPSAFAIILIKIIDNWIGNVAINAKTLKILSITWLPVILTFAGNKPPNVII